MSLSDVRTDLPLSYYLEAVWRKRIVVAAFMTLGLMLAAVAYVCATPTYEASTLILASQADVERDVGAARPRVEAVNSLSRIAESEEVLRTAVERVGLDRLLRASGGGGGIVGRLRGLLSTGPRDADTREGEIDAAARQVGRRLSVVTEPNSEVIRILYRDSDPTLAAAVANAVTQAFIEKQAKLRERPGAADFFRRQKERFEGEVGRLSAELEGFVKQQRTYAVDEQRALLLKRASEAAAALGASRSSLADRQGQREALTAQLRLLRPVTQSSFVSGLVETLGAEGRTALPARAPRGEERTAAGDPPLLMVRVYQDAMVALFKVNAEIAGVQQLAQAQQTESAAIDGELDTLARRQVEFERRKRDLALATYNLDLYAKRAIEEQIDAELHTASFSSLRVAQKAFVPLQPAFPKGMLFLAAGLVLGFVLGSALAVADDLFDLSFVRRVQSLRRSLRFG